MAHSSRKDVRPCVRTIERMCGMTDYRGEREGERHQ